MISMYFTYPPYKKIIFQGLCVKKSSSKKKWCLPFSPCFSYGQNPPLSRPKHSYNKAPRCDWWESDSNTSKRAVPQL